MEVNTKLKPLKKKSDEESPMAFGSSEEFTSDMKKIESTFYVNEDIPLE
jgi:hypothetical protein